MNSNFFTSLRATLFKSRLSQSQVDGINTLLAAMSGQTRPHTAYMLATAYHETAHTMRPIHERGGRKYFAKYDTGRLAKILGNTPAKDGDGYKYRGRGYVQLTGARNYRKAASELGINLFAHPDKALDPDVAATILVVGCTQGWFTGKKLSDYNNFPSMRRVVNGHDRAQLIAGYAEAFQEALSRGEYPAQSAPKIEVTGKPAHKSTTNIAAVTAGLSMTASASNSAKEVIGNLGVDPKWLLLAVGLAAVVWVIRERWLKAYRDGV